MWSKHTNRLHRITTATVIPPIQLRSNNSSELHICHKPCMHGCASVYMYIQYALSVCMVWLHVQDNIPWTKASRHERYMYMWISSCTVHRHPLQTDTLYVCMHAQWSHNKTLSYHSRGSQPPAGHGHRNYLYTLDNDASTWPHSRSIVW